MRHTRSPGGLAALATAIVLAAAVVPARGQGPQVDVDDRSGAGTPPGSLGAPDERDQTVGGVGELGQSIRDQRGEPLQDRRGGGRRTPPAGDQDRFPNLGASGTSGFGTTPGTQERPLGGRAGPAGVRAPVGAFDPPVQGRGTGLDRGSRLRPPEFEPDELASIERLERLEVPAGPDDPGPPDGLTLDAAIDLLLRRNLDLIALQYEIPKAQADILTAGLRSNPIFYADAQLVPYGHYSNARPGGQQQYDVNITVPVDVSRKRLARMAVAERAKQVTEAQFQDAVRTEIDDLYTAYVNVVSARETRRFTQAFLSGMTRLLEQAEADTSGDEKHAEVVDAIRDQVRQAQFQARQAAQVLARTRNTLALLLDLPPEQADRLQIRALLRDVDDLPVPEDDLVRSALANRPDLAAFRLAVHRAEADVRLATANRLSDVYVLYQPYTFQDNRPLGFKSATSWALGINAALPLYNRNQGNIERARWNVRQTQVELTAMERRVANDVKEALDEFRLSRLAVLELERLVLPASRKARDHAFRQFREDPEKVNEYIDKQKDYNDIVREYRNALVEHRRAMLELNTAVAARILP